MSNSRHEKKEFELDNKKFRVGEKIDQGSVGEIRKLQEENNPQSKLLVKIIKASDMKKNLCEFDVEGKIYSLADTSKNLENEARILKELKRGELLFKESIPKRKRAQSTYHPDPQPEQEERPRAKSVGEAPTKQEIIAQMKKKRALEKDRLSKNELPEEDDFYFGLMMEHHEGKTLQQILIESKKNPLTLSQKINLTYALLKEQIFLEEHHFLHGDLHGNNIIISYDYKTAWYIDFNHTSEMDDNGAVKIFRLGNYDYLDKSRRFFQKKPTDKKTEAYSLGLMLAEVWGFAEKMGVGEESRFEWKNINVLTLSPEEAIAYKLIKQLTAPYNERKIVSEVIDEFKLLNENLEKKTRNSNSSPTKELSPEHSKEYNLSEEVKSNTTDPMRELFEKFADKLMNVESRILKKKHSNLVRNWIEKLNKGDSSIDVIEEIVKFYSKKYKEYTPHKITTQFKMFISKDSPKNSTDIMNKNKNEHILTREIGLILKNICSDNENIELLKKQRIFVDVSQFNGLEEKNFEGDVGNTPYPRKHSE